MSEDESNLSSEQEKMKRTPGSRISKPANASTIAAERRSPSPGIATRISPNTPASDSNIDSLSKQLVDTLLDNQVIKAPKEPAPKYVSMNEQLEEKKRKKVVEELAQTEAQIHQQKALLTQIPDASMSFSDNHSENVIYNDIKMKTNGGGELLNETFDALNTSTLNMRKPSVSSNLPPRTQTRWDNSNGMNPLNVDHQTTHEVDILTAMSGEPTPNSLPQVTDGISDGEVSTDEESDGDTGVEDLNILSKPVTRKRSPQLLNDEDDLFFSNHQTIMNTKSSKQKEEIENVLHDIQSAVGRVTSATNGEQHNSDQHQSTTPIWEIRESYAEILRAQEEKRRQRMEMERRYEEEYRERQLDDLNRLEREGKQPPPHSLEEEVDEELNTDYSSDEDGITEHDMEISRGWSWGANKQTYSKLSAASDSPIHRKMSLPPADRVNTQISNASRLADHQKVTSPQAHRKQPASKDTRQSNTSLNSYSSSSQSSTAASTVIRGHERAQSNDSYSSSSGSSVNSWIERNNREDSPPKAIPPPHKEEAQATKTKRDDGEYDTDEETDKLLKKSYTPEAKVNLPSDTKELAAQAMKNRAKEVTVYDPDEPTVLIEGILFGAAYLGSTQLISEAMPSKAIRMMQAQEAVGRIKALGTMYFGDQYKAPDGESQPSTDVDLFVSTEKVMVLNTDLQEIMMDHALRSISYIADIDQILVIMAKRSLVTASSDESSSPVTKQQKLICHIFETDEAHLIAQSIGQAFQVAYMEFLKANGVEDPNIHLKDTSYEDILEQQEIMNDELETFTRKDKQKEVIVPKSKGECLGIVIVESGWGSVLPTVVLANMSPIGAAARCGQLNIGDQIMSVNGISLVGLPLTTCQEHVKAVKNLTAVRLCVVSRPPVVEVLIRRPDKKYQLGFSVQNGVICSLLRGGIAERGGVRVGHRIIEINGSSVVAVTHDKIVHMLSTSVGEIHMKTMPMAVFRLLTGQEVPQYI